MRRPRALGERPLHVIGHGLIGAILFAAPGGLPLAHASATSPSDSETSQQIGERRGWNVYLAEACADTVPAEIDDVVGAVRRTLEADQWHIEHADASTGHVVTRWKKIQHPLARLLLGPVEARCAVAAIPFGPGLTIVMFQGGIASRDDIAQNPGLVLAKRAYRNAARDWQADLLADLRWQGARRARGR
ncbi:MAG: hypothetical protein ACRENN_10335 [Candidatus Eiseniibacteriota bacterium]